MLQHNSVGLLLAAGVGRRFDPTGEKNKLTQMLTNGTPVAVQSARNLLGAVNKVVAVVSSSLLAQLLSEAGCEVYFFSHAEYGMGASLAFAIRQMANSSAQVDSVLVALADMPYVQTKTSQKIVATLAEGADIVQPVFQPAFPQSDQQKSGHPIGFSKRHFPALMTLTGDIGARHLLREFTVQHVLVNDSGILRDIDVPFDLYSTEFNKSVL